MSETPLLLRALRWNALFSGLSAASLLLAANWVAAQLGLGSSLPVYVVATFLAVFSLQLANIVRSGRIRRWEVSAIIGGDVAWVLGSIVLVALFYRSLTDTGLILVDLVAMAVLFFAVQQVRGLRAWRDGEA